ncbi:MAG: hypothetical protein ABGY75_01550 [Gemmataceae bacterium]
MTTRTVWAAVVLTAFAVGCGPPPTPPVDVAAEQEDERLIREAGRAERGPHARPKGKAATPPTRNPDDD